MLLASCLDETVAIHCTARRVVLLGWMLSLSAWGPRKLMLAVQKMQFFILGIMQTNKSCLKTLQRHCLYSGTGFYHAKVASMWQSTLSSPATNYVILPWKCLRAGVMPKRRSLNHCPKGAINITNSFLSKRGGPEYSKEERKVPSVTVSIPEEARAVYVTIPWWA